MKRTNRLLIATLAVALTGWLMIHFGDDWAPTLAQADEVLDRAGAQGLPRCATTQRFLGADARS